MKATGAKAIVKMLEKCGTEIIFGYPGATIAPVYEELADSSIRHILPRVSKRRHMRQVHIHVSAARPAFVWQPQAPVQPTLLQGLQRHTWILFHL